MKRWCCLAFVFLAILPVSAAAIGHNAFHVFGTDTLSDPEHVAPVVDGTEYTPNIPTVPADPVVDGITLRLTFASGETVSPERLIQVTCRGYRPGEDFVIRNDQMRFSVIGLDLIAYYGFVDIDEDQDDWADWVRFDNADCWRFVVSGAEPLTRAEAFISYHTPNTVTETPMPDLLGNRMNLLMPNSSLTDPYSPLSGLQVPIDADRLIVLVHGWNPMGPAEGDIGDGDSDRENHFACDPTTYEGDTRLCWGWSQLVNNLMTNAAIQEGDWTMALYDWSRDASTGSANPLFVIKNSNASRDAAHAHGLHLGNLLSYGRPNLKEVHIIAHSAGNWLARRAAERLRHIYRDRIHIRITSLDPFVNDDDAGPTDDPDLVVDFEMARQWVDYLENYYVVDFDTDFFTGEFEGTGWTSGDFLLWNRNLDIETLGLEQLFDEEYMIEHGGPVRWYADTAVAALDLKMTTNPDPVRPDEQVYYALTVSNLSSSTLTGVVLDAQTPNYMRAYNSANTAGGDCITVSVYCTPGETVRWQLGALAPGEVRTVQMAPVLYDGPPPDGTVLRAEATVYFDGGTATAARDVVVDSARTDTDDDGIGDNIDNCPNTPNPDQADGDYDGLGDVCDAGTDADRDDVPDGSDNCPLISNANQADLDDDGRGDACDAIQEICDGDPLMVDALTFGPGTHTLTSEQRIATQGAVHLTAGADVTFHAPTVMFQPGFRVASGATIHALAGAAVCAAPAAESFTVETTTVQTHEDPNELPADVLASPLPVTHAAQLPDWVIELLALYGVDLDHVDHLLLDPQGWWLLFETPDGVLPADENGLSDIYRLDLLTATLSLLSRTPWGNAGNGPSRYPAADASGELVMFQSDAQDLVADDDNNVTDIFLHEVPLGETSRITATAAGASAHPAVDAAGEDLLYDQQTEAGHRQVLLDGLWGVKAPEPISLAADSTGLLLDNHHPAISADGRFVAYLEALAPAADQPGCQVHLYDRDSGRYRREPCPEALAAGPETARPYFSADGTQVEWYLPGAVGPVVVPNPLLAVPEGGAP